MVTLMRHDVRWIAESRWKLGGSCPRTPSSPYQTTTGQAIGDSMGGESILAGALDVDNYATWSIRMKALLMHKGLWAAVFNGAAAGSTESDKALALIMMNVKDHLAALSKCSGAKRAWDTLEAVYKAKGQRAAAAAATGAQRTSQGAGGATYQVRGPGACAV